MTSNQAKLARKAPLSGFRAKILLSVPASVIAFSLAGPAGAQNVIPSVCTATPSPLASGSTILCVSPTPIGPIRTEVDDLTIVVGDATTPAPNPTIVQSAGS